MHGVASARAADLGMELTLHKCKVLIPGLSQDDVQMRPLMRFVQRSRRILSSAL